MIEQELFLFAASQFSSELNSVGSQIWNPSKQINIKYKFYQTLTSLCFPIIFLVPKMAKGQCVFDIGLQLLVASQGRHT
jgi:hypothetical protein